jgi:hypothetical protein
VICMALGIQTADAQKMLDPYSAGGPLSNVQASSGGSNATIKRAYSVRQLKTNYDHATITPPAAVSGFTNSSTPLLRVRRSTDSAQLDIGYDANGWLDTVTLKNFVTNNGAVSFAHGYVSKWYDQSGNSGDIISATDAMQFRIMRFGQFLRNENNVPGLSDTTGLRMYDQTSTDYGITGNFTSSVVVLPKLWNNGPLTLAGGSYALERNQTTQADLVCIKVVNNNWSTQIRTGSDINQSRMGDIALSATRTDAVMMIRNNDEYPLFVNNELAALSSLGGGNAMQPVSFFGATGGHKFYYYEAIIFPSALSVMNRDALGTSQNVIRGIVSTPTAGTGKMLDAVSGQGPLNFITSSSAGANSSIALAYSIRQLKSTYDHAAITPPTPVSGFTNSTTPLVRVRRTSDNGQLDIGYDANGLIDTTAIKNFVSNNGANPTASGYLTVWYDQSGNSKDAKQTVTTKQLRIINAGVVEKNASGIPGPVNPGGAFMDDGGDATDAPNGQNRYGIKRDRSVTIVCETRSYVNGSNANATGTYMLDRNWEEGNANAPDLNPNTTFRIIGDKYIFMPRQDSYGGFPDYVGNINVALNRTVNINGVRKGITYYLEVNGAFAGSSNTIQGDNTMVAVRIGRGNAITENMYFGEILLFPDDLSSENKEILNNDINTMFKLGTSTWTGAVSTDWNNANNWSPTGVPDKATSVIIPSGTLRSLAITGTPSAKHLTIESGASVTSTVTLYVYGSANVQGTISGTGQVRMEADGQGTYGSSAPQYVRGNFSNLTNANNVGKVVASGDISISGTLDNQSNVLDMKSYALSGTLNTITNTGIIYTANTSTTPLPTGKTWPGSVIYNNTSGGQTIMAGTYNNLSLANSSGIQTASGDLIVNGALGTHSDGAGTFSMGTYRLSGTLTSINNYGTLSTANTSSTTPIPSGKTWGGTVTYNATNGGQTVVKGTYKKITTANTSGENTLAGTGTFVVTDTLAINGTFNLDTCVFYGTAPVIVNNGTLKTKNTTATPLPAGRAWGGTVEYAATNGGQTIVNATSYTNLTLSNTTGRQTPNTSLSVNGTLTLTTANDTLYLDTIRLQGTLASVVNNGTIYTRNTTANPLPANKNWGTSGTVSYGVTAGGQTIAGGFYNNLNLSHTSGTDTASGNISLTGNLTTLGGIFDLKTYSFEAAVSSNISNSGIIRTAHTATANALPSGKTWSNTVEYYATGGAQTVASGTYNNLTLGNSTGTQTANGNLTVNGIFLNSSVSGMLNMGTYQLGGTLATITNNGTITTQNTSATPIPVNRNWGGTINYNATSGGQTVVKATYKKLITGNSSGENTVAGTGALIITDTLITTSNGTFNLDTCVFSGTSPVTINNGTIKTKNTSATPLPTGRTWGGTVEYAATTGAQTIVNATSYNNLTISNTSGNQTPANDLTVGGTLTIANTNATLYLNTLKLAGALPSIINNGTIYTLNTSSTPLPSGKTWGGTGTVRYGTAAGGQTVMGGIYNSLRVDNSSNSNTVEGNLTVDGTLTTTAGGTLTMTAYTLSGNLTSIVNDGLITTDNTSSAPLASGKTWGGTGTVRYNVAAGAQTIVGGTYNNLTLSNTSGTNSASGDITTTGNLTTQTGTFDLQTNRLIGVAGTLTNNGTVRTAHTATANALPTGKTWGSTVEYYAANGTQTLAAGTYNNFIQSNTSGTNTANGTLTVNGTLTTMVGGTLDIATNLLTGSLTTVSNNGIIKTFNTTATPLPTGRNWSGNGNGTLEYASTNGGQTVVAGTYANLTLSNTQNTNAAEGTLVINGALRSTSGGTLNMGTYALEGTFTANTANGIIATSNVSSQPFPSGKVWGGSVVYAKTDGGQTIVGGYYSRLTLGNNSNTNQASGDITAAADLTVAGGVFDLGNYTLQAPSWININNSGTIRTQNTTTAALSNGITWTGTVEYYAAAGTQTIARGTYANLLMSNTSGTQSLNGTTTVSGAITLSGGKLALGSNTLNMNGTINGHSANSSFIANGSSNITIGGSGALGSSLYFDPTTPGTTNRLNNFTYNRSSQTITLGNALQVAGLVTPTAGTLATNNMLTLVSNASGTASIAAGSGSYITGNVTAERFIPSVARRFRFLASPMIGATLADWQNEIYITGAGGAANGFDPTVSNQASAFSYNEAAPGDYNTNGWVAATNTNNPVPVGKGFRILVRGDRSDPSVLNGTNGTQAAVTMNAIGVVNSGNITMPVTFTSSGNSANDGWNLVGNPYPSAIDWNAFHDAGRTGSSPDYSGTDYAHLDAVATVYDANTNGYASYNAISNTGTGVFSSGVIPSGAAFWVKASAASPLMTMKEVYKTASTPAGMFKSANEPTFILKLVQDAITADEMIVKYIPEADANKDVYDIPKLYGEANIASITENNTHLSGNCKPFNGISDIIKLSLGVGKTGNYSFEFKNVKQLAANLPVHLVDAFTNKTIDINSNDSYNFMVDKTNEASFGNNRFMIVVGEVPATTALEEMINSNALSLYPALTQGEVTISNSKPKDEDVTVKITDATGREIVTLNNLQWNGQKISLDLSAYKAGAYFIAVTSVSQSKIFKCIKQ